MKLSLTALIIYFLGIGELFSQSNFRNGYIIKNDNDTIYGLIEYKGNNLSSKKCFFKKGSDSEILKFSPDEIQAYRFIDGKYYVSKIVNTNEGKGKLFLEYLIHGAVDIYYYRDDNLGEHYLIDKGYDRLIELKNEKKEETINNSNFVKESKEYIGILKYTFIESPSICKKVENISLKHNSLIGIAKEYQDEVCPDQKCIIYEKKLPKRKSVFGAIIGFNVYTLSTKDKYTDDYYFLRIKHSNNAVYPAVGFFYKISLPKLNEKLHFQNEATISKRNLKFTSSYIDPVSNFDYIHNISLIQYAFNYTGVIKYESLKGKLRPTFQAGFFENTSITKYKHNVEVKWESGETFYNQELTDNPFPKFDLGLNLGMGVCCKFNNQREVFLDFQYQRQFGTVYYGNNFKVNLSMQIGK